MCKNECEPKSVKTPLNTGSLKELEGVNQQKRNVTFI